MGMRPAARETRPRPTPPESHDDGNASRAALFVLRTSYLVLHPNPTRSTHMDGLTPAQIVAELDKYIVGQRDAKRAVAIALRARLRREQLSDELRDEVSPKNILMI